MVDLLARRRFLQVLAASAFAAGVLPVGFPQEAVQPWYWYAIPDEDGTIVGHMTASHPYHLHPEAPPTRRLTRQQYDRLVLEFRAKRRD